MQKKNITASEFIVLKGARVNNLKNVSTDIPRNKLVVITGVSGSGKSSLAFDTLFAEGQRRFAQSLSAYSRQFLGRMSRPDVDLIDGIPPAVAINQGVKTKNPRSTVGTTTEVYDHLRLIFARIGRTYSPLSGQEVRCHNLKDVCNAVEAAASDGCYILADLDFEHRQDRTECLLTLMQDGFSRLFNGKDIVRIEQLLQGGEENYPSQAYLLIDRIKVAPVPVTATPESTAPATPASPLDADTRTRIMDSASSAFSRGKGVCFIYNIKTDALDRFSRRFEADGIEFIKPDENLFSYNSPLGACTRCGGLGKIEGISEELVIPDKSLSIYDSCIAPYRGEKMTWFRNQIINNSQRYDIPIFEPYCNLDKRVKDILWKGLKGETDEETIYGINEFFAYLESKKYKIQNKYMISRYSGRAQCPECEGSRLRPEALYVKVCGKNIHELLSLTVDELLKFLSELSLEEWEKKLIERPLKEVRTRLECLQDVGLGYLSLNRASNTLSGGESQRVSLVSILGNSLVGSLYILDEPSIGLHSRDTNRLINVLKRLRDLGNTIVVVEHDEDVIKAADYLIDIGPRAGKNGGEIVFEGAVKDLPSRKSLEAIAVTDAATNAATDATATEDNLATTLKAIHRSLTLEYIYGFRKQYVRTPRFPAGWISLEGAMQNNLKNIDVKFPLGMMTVVTGVSGSGKSSLVGDILYPALQRHFGQSGEAPGVFRKLGGDLDKISRVEYIDQSSIGRSSRSNPVTYLKVYEDIRKLFASQQYALMNGFTPVFFSFNADGGRCPECEGEGAIHIGMQFMSDVTMVCESCGGKRFKPEILEVKYRGKDISDVLNMSVDEAIEFFGSEKESAAKRIAERLVPLQQVGLGYLSLGQSSSTLSGGESQRIKLAYYLAYSEGPKNEKIMFIFDEPTTGLHFYDVEKLLRAFDMLLERGHSIIVVEHNPDVIRSAGHIIDLGPDAGDKGGEIVYEGSVDGLKKCKKSITAKYI
ncbi:MAG: excinuclease ABC subunit UvrA [Bacteroidales bacterium]|nr:excinuclease ABC subunit UvrA [Bacteroidales bacterium]